MNRACISATKIAKREMVKADGEMERKLEKMALIKNTRVV
jgi:hypothetical protein